MSNTNILAKRLKPETTKTKKVLNVPNHCGIQPTVAITTSLKTKPPTRKSPNHPASNCNKNGPQRFPFLRSPLRMCGKYPRTPDTISYQLIETHDASVTDPLTKLPINHSRFSFHTDTMAIVYVLHR